MATTQPLIGSHISIAGGMHLAFERAESLGCTAFQIFTKSNRSWFAQPLTEEAIILFKQSWKASSVQYVMAHSSYLINIGSKNKETATKSTQSLKKEILRCKQLGIPHLVLHPGSHVGLGEEVCIQQIAENLDHALEENNGSVKILLETMAGQGTNIGYIFEHLANIRQLSHHKKQLGICFDTCHVFSAGYNISTTSGYEETINEFDQIIGLNHLHAIHINDSKTICGSRKDRHESLGKGKIPLATYKKIMQDKRIKNIPKILETPEVDLYAEEIALLKKYAS